jgi:phage shock protein C
MKYKKQLYRNDADRIIGGVCSGIADYFDIDTSLVRGIFFFLLCFTFTSELFLLYIIMWCITPSNDEYSI